MESVKLEIWKQRIEEQRKSNQSAASWCRQNEIKESQFHYYRDKFYPSQTERKFTELKDKKSYLNVSVNGFAIQLEENFDPACLKQFLQVVRELSC